jgi:hypothetical protein
MESFMLGFFSRKLPVPTVVNGRVQLPDEPFNYHLGAHLELITLQVTRFNTALNNLQAIDRGIFIGGALCFSAYIGQYLFPLAWLSCAGSAICAYNFALRAQSYTQYREAQEDLINIYAWAMGKDTGNHWYKLPLEQIQVLIRTLGPWVSSETIHTWKDEDLKPGLVAGITSSRRQDVPEEFETLLTRLAVGTQATNWSFRLYGENGMGMEDLWKLFRATLTSKAADAAANLCLNNKTL